MKMQIAPILKRRPAIAIGGIPSSPIFIDTAFPPHMRYTKRAKIMVEKLKSLLNGLYLLSGKLNLFFYYIIKNHTEEDNTI